MPFSRRKLLQFCGSSGLVAAGSMLGLGACRAGGSTAPAADAQRRYEVSYSDAQWRQRLTPAQYAVLRQRGTERAYSSPLNDEHRRGTFACAGCALPLYAAATKFDSGTGWPSFWAPLHGAIETATDRTFGMVRTEVRCRRCGGHLGHVFDDGPKPTGLRYCMNGVAMTFVPA